MATRQIEAPSQLPVTLAAVKANLGIDGGDHDDILTLWIMGVCEYAETITKRAIMSQRWRATFDAFPDVVRLEHPPLVSVQSVRFVDAAGNLQTLDPADYRLDVESEPGCIVPARGKAWPATYPEMNAVSVDYTCGYAPENVPAKVKLFILAKLREQYDPAVQPGKGAIQGGFVDGLLDRLVVYA